MDKIKLVPDEYGRINIADPAPPTVDGHRFKAGTPILTTGYVPHPLIHLREERRRGLLIGEKMYVVIDDGHYRRVDAGGYQRWFMNARRIEQQYLQMLQTGFDAIAEADRIWELT